MKKRTIQITVTFDSSDSHESQITPREKVREMVLKEIEPIFEQDEGYEGVEVEVIDEY